jgi:hypothetical protein
VRHQPIQIEAVAIELAACRCDQTLRLTPTTSSRHASA